MSDLVGSQNCLLSYVMALIPFTKLSGQSKGGKGEKKVKKEKKGKKEKTKTESDDDEEEDEEEEEEEKEEEESDVEVHHHTNIPMQYIVNTTAHLTFILLSYRAVEILQKITCPGTSR